MTPSNVRSFAGLQIDDRENLSNGVFMALYGKGGVGKTTILADIVRSPHGTPALLVDVEGGSSSVTHLKKYGLDVVHATTWKQIQAIKKAIEAGGHEYRSIIWDNLSEITNIYKLVVAPSGIPEIQQWGKILAEMMEFVRDARELTETNGINVGFCLWEEYRENPETGITKLQVNLFRSFTSTFPGMVTQIGHVSVPLNFSENRLLSFKPDDRNDSKFRVAPTDAADNIPKELWLDRDDYFLVDFLAMLKEGVSFPVEKYRKPVKSTRTNG